MADSLPSINPWLAALVYPLGRYLVLPLYFASIQVEGREHLPCQGPLVLAPSHQSYWDALMVGYAAGKDITGRHLRFMVSTNEMGGLQGWLIRHLGGFALDPERPSVASLRQGVGVLVQAEVLVVFPEGGEFVRDRASQLHQLKPGLARLALQADATAGGVQIVPMGIRYTPSIPRWRTRVQIRIGPPLAVADYHQGPARQSAQKITEALAAALKALVEQLG